MKDVILMARITQSGTGRYKSSVPVPWTLFTLQKAQESKGDYFRCALKHLEACSEAGCSVEEMNPAAPFHHQCYLLLPTHSASGAASVRHFDILLSCWIHSPLHQLCSQGE